MTIIMDKCFSVELLFLDSWSTLPEGSKLCIASDSVLLFELGHIKLRNFLLGFLFHPIFIDNYKLSIL